MNSLEQERLANIEANKTLLASLNLHNGPGSAAAPATTASAESKAKRKASSSSSSTAGAPRPKAVKRESADNVPTRRSGRLSTAVQSDPVAAETLAKRQREEEEAAEEERQRAKRARHEDRVVSAIKRTGAQWSDDDEEAAASKNLIALLGSASRLPVSEPDLSLSPATRSRSSTPAKPTKGRKTVSRDPEVKELSEQMANMDVKKACKATPDRVYSLAVHPSVDKELVFVGDKNGRLGISDVTKPDEEEEDDDEDGEEKDSFAIQAHAKSAISALRLAPHQPHTLFSASYDCSARSINFETGVSTEVLDADALTSDDYGTGEALLSSMDFSPSGHELWMADNLGGVYHVDLRSSSRREKARRWELSHNKIGGISLCQANENHFVTAHLSREMRLYDARMLRSRSTELDHHEHNEHVMLDSYAHSKACSSANFDPTSRHIVSTSYDDLLRVWDVDAPQLTKEGEVGEPSHKIPHNNQTGRYVSVFKAQWSRNADVVPHFTVGNMKRHIDVFAYDGTNVAQLKSDQLTAVPAVTGSHPNIVARAYGANASGKLYAWAPVEDEEE